MSKPVQYFYVAGAFLIAALETDGFASFIGWVLTASALANALLEAFTDLDDKE